MEAQSSFLFLFGIMCHDRSSIALIQAITIHHAVSLTKHPCQLLHALIVWHSFVWRVEILRSNGLDIGAPVFLASKRFNVSASARTPAERVARMEQSGEQHFPGDLRPACCGSENGAKHWVGIP